MKSHLGAVVLVGTAILPQPAAAQGRPSDVQCLLVSNLFANGAKDLQAKQLATTSSLFYAGRVSHLPDARIRAAIAGLPKQLDAKATGMLMNSCAQAMRASVSKLQAVTFSTLSKNK